jgi:di/tricarboxylate transporter
MADSTIVFLVLAGVVVLFIADVFPSEVVAMSSALTLWATGVLDLEQTLAGFGNPTVIFVASLLAVATALDTSGVSAWAGQHLINHGAGSRRRLTILTMALSAVLTSVITVHGAVAALIPVVVVTGLRVGIPTSKLLLPVAFAAHAGSQLTLTGSQVNILYSEAARDAGIGYFGFFEYTVVGLPLVAGTIAIVVTVGDRLLPSRTPPDLAADYSRHAATLIAHYDVDDDLGGRLFDRRVGTVEIVIPPRSSLIGTVVSPGLPTGVGGFVVLVVHRQGDAAGPEPTALEAGDVLLVRGDWHRLADNLRDSDVLVVDDPDEVRRHIIPWGPGARRTLGIVLALVVLLATGAVPPAVAGLLAAGALIVTRVLSVDAAYHGINWTTIVLIAGMIPMSTAMTSSGAADDIAGAITGLVDEGEPHLLLVVLFVVVAVLGQLISNTATALIVIPVAIAAAADLDVSIRPVLMSLNVVTVAALLTPVATAANTMIMRPGGYRFGDYVKLGLPLLAWWFVIAVGLVPLIWQF